RLPGPGDRSRSQHHRQQGQRRGHRARGGENEGRTREGSRATGEPRVKPMVVVLSSPSGGGKTTIARRVLAGRSDMGYSVSATTRAPRTGEVAGREYHFLSQGEFARRVEAGEFLEYADYNGNRYGTLDSEVGRVNGAGKHVLLDIEIQGARLVRERFPEALLIFVIPPSGAVLAGRLRGRGTESDEVIDGRLRRAVEEIGAAG